MSRQIDRAEKVDRLADRQYDRQVALVARVTNAFHDVAPFEDFAVKEPQGRHRLVEQNVRSVLLIAEPDLIRDDVLGPELIGRCLEVAGKVNDSGDVRLFGSR